MKQIELSVGAVAARCGVSVSALHFYERKGLIHSTRNAGNQRRLGKDVIRRVSIIKAAQQLGISLAEVQRVFAGLPRHSAPGKQHWQALSGQWQEALNQRIRRLESLRDSLTGCIGCGCLSMEVCPLYNADDHLGNTSTGPVLLTGQ